MNGEFQAYSARRALGDRTTFDISDAWCFAENL
jgi:hypothetical protein